MCGIAGLYGFRDDSLIKKISEQLLHRGPDGEGYYLSDQVSLLNRRLAIIDRKGGDQPIFNEDKTVAVVYNGEIYNFRRLRSELQKAGHKFRTNSDTEVIAHGYEEWDYRCFDKFNGMFAVALYDLKKNKLILARDHFGIKPLYYSVLNSSSENRNISGNAAQVIFSSEIKPLINSGLIVKKPNDRIIYRYLRYRIHDDQRETFFQGVYRVMPGEILEAINKNIETKSFTNLRADLLKASVHPQGGQARKLTKNQIDVFRKKLIEAIKLRLISEVPVGTCLSGGIDSSVIVSIVNKLLKDKVTEAESVGKIQNTFSAVFPGNSNDEEKYVNQVLKFISLKNYKVKPNSEEFFRDLADFVKIQEEPTISTGPYAQYKVMQQASKHVTVLLDGQGADEMLAGYMPYYFVYLNQLVKEKDWLILIKTIAKSLDILGYYFIYLFQLVTGIRKSFRAGDLLNREYSRKFSQEEYQPTDDNLKKRLVEDIFINSLPALLRYEDKNGMRFSLEGRVPFLDFNLLKYLFSLPDGAIFKNGWNKYILRKSTGGLIPKKCTLRRNKIGFTTPEYEWLRQMKDKIYSIFLSDSFAGRKYFNQTAVVKAWQKFNDSNSDDTMLFWRLINLEIWLRVFFDSDPRKASEGKDQKAFDIGSPNKGKKLETEVKGGKYLRFLIRTEVIKKGDDIVYKLSKKIVSLLPGIIESPLLYSPPYQRKFFLVVSEKIVAIAQGRSYFLWDIKCGFWSNLLSKFVKKTPYGIGLGSPWTMQLTINEIGLARTVLAAAVGKTAQVFGIKGLFYRLAGSDVAAIDGPTEYSLYPSNVSAKLGPKNPQLVAENIKLQITNDKSISNSKLQIAYFLGVVIIDANDLGQKVLGNSTGLDNKLVEKVFSDNPMGQADEQTPMALVFIK
ncbi:asparagine synthase (glutamine-hydrolyzing) [Candidatus Roizmanbacteria bacterium RIFCSPHIGHO2_01_FULL_39_12c]|uniref:asparagine synthase (glutamine-hydrolyzing) n=1 Tax=Candidatus Roizmanbacteria bacterium RIFCSPHIGHO2_01_FULL_39_12c TaxID=1802031 RepID=A0A1F7GEQ7_9BACT|nr:MAG: asparagine synthase (glutamine-hydrolyzing) [Candidatus Roizmanbacteria bacterium RIFCSPHIGHO2_01_FULL_39_12c]OGK48089.1 MAG: asparagine synthase (glutamine-hydrolyzing) [Candidatus Roizmanbacteria bacterium RIFCSPLOWO2_01_FULL_40_13]